MSEREQATYDLDAGASARPVGRYEILSEIGRGGMGIVYLARQRDLDRLVALKALQGFHARAGESAERFVRESRLAGSLSHPNIVTVYEYFEDDQTPYIAMEYVPRGSLRPWVGYLSLGQLAGVLEGLLAGLSAVEPSGIVHRDLKPENVMITADGRAKIADFGIAKATETANEEELDESTSGAAMGTPAYMAPEQALGEDLGPWTDLYSVGIIAYEQLVGHVPFHDSHTPMSVLLRHINEPVRAVSESRPDVDGSLSDWVARLLAKDAAARVRSAAEAWEELEEIIIGLLGPRWRREARLPEQSAEPAAPVPTPAHFLSQRVSLPIVAAQTAGPNSTLRTPQQQAERSTPRTVARSTRGLAGGSRRVGQRGLAAGIVIVAIAALLGWAIAPPERSSGTVPQLRGGAADAAFSVRLPANWRHASGLVLGRRLGLADPLTASSSFPGGALTIGASKSSSPTLLPSGLLAALPAPPNREVVRLNGRAFYRYRNLRPAGAGIVEAAYAQPTTSGIVIGVCALPSVNATLANADCERILGSLQLTRAVALPLGPRPSYAATLSSAISQLDTARRGDGQRLQDAKTPSAQASAALLLSHAYQRSAAAVRGATPGPAEATANASMLSALQHAADGYATIAVGANTESAGVFDRGRGSVTSADAALTSALSQLARFGYSAGR